ncbi:MAG: alpha-glucan family phosphorylase [Bacteroidetes bacterium HGW-Bacteroidetes-4]|jgi:phosphorylase/glycogen(starch) synthase|nr:MAG: alpha-glucan family phosphorylase [Bacteroidetes bacterium HGW-Bacteroidetes-4]
MEENGMFLFETSWEVCNKVGGIHTVITSKLPSYYQVFGENMIFIGPDILSNKQTHPEFIEDKNLFQDWKATANCHEVRFRTGYWNVPNKPKALLVDFTALIPQKDEIFTHLWEVFKLDSLSGEWDYVESALFGYATGMVIKSFSEFYLIDKKVVAQFHEWMTGAGVLFLKENAPQIATVFTTHATVLGRSIAGNGLPLYSSIGSFDPDQKAKDIGVSAKHSLEKNASILSDVFTTVSKVTANECEFLLNNEPDFITPNGFALEHLEKITESTINSARTILCKVTNALTGGSCNENTLFIATSGRYEFKNKGIDVFLDSLGKLNQNPALNNQVVAFILVPNEQYGPRKELLENLKSGQFQPLPNPFTTHSLNPNRYDPIIDRCQQLNLWNKPEQKVKVIFAPVYLNGNDGIFNTDYYHLLSGFHMSAFPSYYEPWGYTPMESLAVGVPTVTTSLSGFGQWMQKKSTDLMDGLGVVKRTEDNYNQVVEQIESWTLSMSNLSKNERKTISIKAKALTTDTVWQNFSKYYYDAYEKATQTASKREKTNYLSKIAYKPMENKQTSNEPIWKKMIIHSNLPGALKQLDELSMNLWWCWNYEAMELFESVSPDTWKKCQKNPVVLLKTVSSDRFEELTKDKSFLKHLDKVYTDFRNYMDTPVQKNMPKIGYFSMEYGLTDNLKIYSGGLGILAGDYLKEASDCNIPMIAVGFLYKYGYFTQHLSVSGEQQASLVPQKFADLPIEPIYDELKQLVTVSVNLPGRIVKARIWKVMVGRIPLFLLDTDYLENSPEDRTISHQLYGGDWENRLKQEIILGFGGIRALGELNLNPDIYHCNEGHAAMINVERLSDLIQHENLTFDEAMEVVRSSSLFTTHTPVPAGHDAFDEELIRTYMRHLPERLKIDWETFLNLGRGVDNAHGEKFSMSVLATKTSQEMNGVSRLHGDVSKEMFQYMWKGFSASELHIDYVTNGVHYPTWTASKWRKLYESQFGEGFLNDLSNPSYWEKIFEVDDKTIWETRNQYRKRLIDYVKERYHESFIRRHENPKLIVDILNSVNEKTLTIGFARRFATYKRAHLIFSDIERLARIANNPDRPVQFLFAGKAHPNDKAGQDLIKHIIEISRRPEFIGKILFLENYDMELAKRLVRGVDIWLNNPTRPLEASGTSGQKAEMNGVLNFSVLDGWWVEGYKEKAGWALPEKRTYANQDFQNELDAATIYSILENEITPLYYTRDKNDIPVEWVQYIKRSIAGIAPHFTTKRMLDDYINKFYLKLHKRTTRIQANGYKLAMELSQWKNKIRASWDQIDLVSVDFPNTMKAAFKMGENYRGEVVLDLKGLSEDDLGVELVFALQGGQKIIDIKELKLTKKVDTLAFYEINFELKKPGTYDYGLRIFPKNKELPHRQDFAYLRWI